MAGHIIVVGSLNMDLVVRSPRHPLPGETLLGSDFHTFPGRQRRQSGCGGGALWAVLSLWWERGH